MIHCEQYSGAWEIVLVVIIIMLGGYACGKMIEMINPHLYKSEVKK